MRIPLGKFETVQASNYPVAQLNTTTGVRKPTPDRRRGRSKADSAARVRLDAGGNDSATEQRAANSQCSARLRLMRSNGTEPSSSPVSLEDHRSEDEYDGSGYVGLPVEVSVFI
jgi:hypothetical protein